MTQRSDIRKVLQCWRTHDWRDVDNAAVAVVEAMHAGAGPEASLKAISDEFLARNSATRAEVARVTLPLLGEIDAGPVENHACALILTAIPVEHRSVQAVLRQHKVVRGESGTRFSVGTTIGKHLSWTVFLAEIGAGNASAAALTAAAIAELNPDLVMFVGVAAGIKEDAIHGAVVVADFVHTYESGKQTATGFLARPRSLPTPHGIVQLARAIGRSSDIKVIIKPIIAGESVVTSPDSVAAEIAFNHYNDAVALDMESSGMYLAAHQAGLPAVAIRGISDRFSDKTQTNDDTWQPIAARNAASVAIRLLQEAEPQDIRKDLK